MRQTATFTTRIEGKLVRTPKPLSKGKALIQAREILGPSASVHSFMGGFTIRLEHGPSFVAVSWEQALKLAQDSPQANQWNDKVIADANTLTDAVNSLRATAIKVLKAGTKHLSRKEHRFVVAGVRAHP